MTDDTNTGPLPTYHDLASAVNATKEFCGLPTEDVYAWEQELLMYIELFSLQEVNTKRLIACKVRGKAQTWLSNLIKENPWYTAKDILTALKNQFSNTDILHQKLNKFLSTPQSMSKDELNRMLELADDLFQRNAINERSLIKLAIARCPPTLRPLLVKFSLNDGEWYLFLREAKENMWIAFTEEIIHSNSELLPHQSVFEMKNQKLTFKNKNQQKNKGKIWCRIHNSTFHSTEDCKLRKEFEKRNLKLVPTKNVQSVEELQNEDCDMDLNFLNKNKNSYLFSINSSNFFIIDIKLKYNTISSALLDTGAEISLMEEKDIPAGTKLEFK
ncbi:hypothetical protein COBT_002211 [Conglomerata obtusa]